MITPADPNVSLRPTIEPTKIADINPDSAGGSTSHLIEVPSPEHVNKTASPGHATLVLDTREASEVGVNVNVKLADNKESNVVVIMSLTYS